MFILPIVGRNPSMVIPLLANQDLTPMVPLCRFFGAQAIIFTSYNTNFLNRNLAKVQQRRSQAIYLTQALPSFKLLFTPVLG